MWVVIFIHSLLSLINFLIFYYPILTPFSCSINMFSNICKTNNKLPKILIKKKWFFLLQHHSSIFASITTRTQRSDHESCSCSCCCSSFFYSFCSCCRNFCHQRYSSSHSSHSSQSCSSNS